MEKLRPRNFGKIMHPCYRTTLDSNNIETRV